MEKIVKDIDYNLKFITAYVTFSEQLISSEYYKLFGHFIGNSFDEKNNDYFNQLQEIYREFVEQDDIITRNMIEIEEINDIDLKISMYKKHFKYYYKIREIFERFIALKDNNLYNI